MIEEFPDDENGKTLLYMFNDGDDLANPREIDSSAVFSTKAKADRLAEVFRCLGYRVAIQTSGVVPELPWDVTVTKFMVPTHQAVTEFENEIQERSVTLGGRTDGWGCFGRARPDQ